MLQDDNGTAYLCAPVRKELEDQRVIQLLSRVHTPTDNAATEHAHAEVKAEAGLGKGVVLKDHVEAALRLPSLPTCAETPTP